MEISELSSTILLDKCAEDQNGSSTAFILNEVEGLTVDSWTMLTTSSSATLTVNGSTPLTTCRTSKVRDSAGSLTIEYSYWANSQAALHPETDS
jgi:hypothetical protein